MDQFKPNIYPIMYWGLMFGLIGGFVLFVIFLLSRYITVVWFPVFLSGVIWGSYRNYKKQKAAWAVQGGHTSKPQSAVAEFKEAAEDIVVATKDMLAEQKAEDAVGVEPGPESAGADDNEMQPQPPAPPAQPSESSPEEQPPAPKNPKPPADSQSG